MPPRNVRAGRAGGDPGVGGRGGRDRSVAARRNAEPAMPRISPEKQALVDAEHARERAERVVQLRAEVRATEAREEERTRKAVERASRNPEDFSVGFSTHDGADGATEVTLSLRGSDGQEIDLKEYLSELEDFDVRLSPDGAFHFQDKPADRPDAKAVILIPERLTSDAGSPEDSARRLLEVAEAIIGREKEKKVAEAREKLEHELVHIYEGHAHEPPVRWADRVEHWAAEFPSKHLFWDDKAKDYKKLEDAYAKADREREAYVSEKLQGFADALKNGENVDLEAVLGGISARPADTNLIFSGPQSEGRGSFEQNDSVRTRVVDAVWDKRDAEGSQRLIPRAARATGRFLHRDVGAVTRTMGGVALGAGIGLVVAGWKMGGRFLYKQLSRFFHNVVGAEDHPHSTVPVFGGAIDWLQGKMRGFSEEVLPLLDEKGAGGHGGGGGAHH